MGAAPLEGFQELVARLDYPMVVVTVPARPHHQGCLVGFHTQTSIDPARLLVCLSRANATTRAAQDASHVGVHVLGHDQRELARLFGTESGDWTDKLAHAPWREGPHGVPLLDGCSGWLVGHVESRHDLGDHIGLLLSPVAAESVDDRPLVTFQQVKDLEAGHPA
ncbi:MAG TPA: flavin reductase family protein [Mycobacteriales bacterium]|nr:flavin reductase family protein [Mycobacteriales bacterium]